MSARKVTITLSKKVVGSYEARAYPDDDFDNDGLIELYKVPVHEVRVAGTDDAGAAVEHVHSAPRFMPYYNDPANPDPHYRYTGWLNAGLWRKKTVVVGKYKPEYRLRNRYSPGRGAIVLKDAFYIHAGPADLSDVGFGSAGCVEIIGNYDDFKGHIADLSGTKADTADKAILALVKAKKLVVEIEETTVPDIRTLFSRQVPA